MTSGDDALVGSDMRTRTFGGSISHSRDSGSSYQRPIARGRRTGHDVRRMSPTVVRERGYRAFFFSREEARMHVHIQHAGGEAKVWIEPRVEVAQNYGLSPRQLAAALRLVRRNENEIRAAWEEHFGR